VKERNRRRYYYRVLSIRNGEKIMKKRIYLGSNLSQLELRSKEIEADKKILQEKIDKNLEKFKEVIVKVLKRYNIKKAGIFGSYVRGEQRKDSDIDILVEYPNGLGLRFVGLALELENKLGKKVDLVTYSGIHPLLKKSILREEVKII
jgi:predicted nucleotidyltransferase